MDAETFDEEWDVLAGLLPPRWREWARSEKALVRTRGVADADALLKLILMHAGAGLSLQQTSVRAKVHGIAQISAPAIHGRLRASEAWLNRITREMVSSAKQRFDDLLPGGRRVRVLDATTISEPGSTGTDWRLHYSIALPSLRCDFFKLTDNKTGETYDNVPVEAGDVVLADRAYCHREAVAKLKERGGDVVVRLALGNFPLEDLRGVTFDLLTALRKLRGRKPREWDVQFEANGRKHSARLCAIRKSRAKAERDRERIKKQRRKKQKVASEETLEAAGYVFVLTTLPHAEISTDQLLELYRARWQVELSFKRLKSLLSAGHVPKYDERSARAWIQAKLLTALLIERLQQKARFSPWGFEELPAEPVA